MSTDSMPQTATALPYRDAYDVIEDARFLVRMWIERHLILYRSRYEKPNPADSHLYVGRREVDGFLQGTSGVSADVSAKLAQIAEGEELYRKHLHARMVATEQAGGRLPLFELRTAFDLRDERVFDMLLALLVVEVDADFQRAFCHAWCDFTRRHVDVGFLLELVARSSEERDRLLQLFVAGDHVLFSLGALEVGRVRQTQGRTMVQRSVRLSDRLVQFISGEVTPPTDVIGPHGRMIHRTEGFDGVLVPDEVRDAVNRAAREGFRSRDRGMMLHLHGASGSGRRSLAAASVGAMARTLLLVEAADLTDDPAAFGSRLRAIALEARLQQAVPMFSDIDTWWSDVTDPRESDPIEPFTRQLASLLHLHQGLLITSGHEEIPGLPTRIPGARQVQVPNPTAEIQRALWTQALGTGFRWADGFEVADITSRYSLTGGTIASVVASLREDEVNTLTAAVVFPVIRSHLSHRLGSLALAVERGFAWDDLVVPEKTRKRLDELVAFVDQRERITREWGFGAKLAYGRGTVALFFGPPGTGKTMAASIIGTQLGMEVFRVDTSRVVDKYIGETEKNLGKIFTEAQRAQAMLLFDEADSLFAKRTSVKSSVDRYANLEVNFLLQMMEAYEGICVLTTNFHESIDQAFKRRIRFKVEFPFPTMEERLALWKAMIPPEAPVADDVDWEDLAEYYELSGAHIKNVMLRAASLAAQAGTNLTYKVFVEAANREYAELGKVVREFDLDA